MDQDERPAAPVSRSSNVVHVMPHDWGTIRHFLAPALERLDRATAATQLLVVTPDAETALAMADAARTARPDAPDALLVPVTAPRRLQRQAHQRVPLGVAGTPAALAELLESATLKLDTVRTVIIAWADDVLAHGGEDALATVLAEVPKDSVRIVVTGQLSEKVEALVERYARRARLSAPAASDQPNAPDLRIGYVGVGATGRSAALRRLLDAIDPPSAVVVAGTAEAAAEARATLQTLGYGADDALVRVADTLTEPVALAVLYDLPTDAGTLRAVATARPTQVIALVQPRQVSALRRLATGARVTPWTLPDTLDAARSREERVRDLLRAELAAGAPAREMLALEPLLDEYDALEIAAALLRQLEASPRPRRAIAEAPAEVVAAPAPRAAEPAPAATRPAAPRVAAPGAKVRIFLSVGGQDGASPGDVLGAVINEAGIERDQVGRIELRDSHTLVEVDAAVADQVVERLAGTAIRGRHVAARVDRMRDASPRDERGARGDRPRGGGFGARERTGGFDRPKSGSFGARERTGSGERSREGHFSRQARAGEGDRARPSSSGYQRQERTGPSDRPRSGGFDRQERSNPPLRGRSPGPVRSWR